MWDKSVWYINLNRSIYYSRNKLMYMTRYVISDHHFNHENIIDYCDRPYDNVDEMNIEMTKLWNECVNDEPSSRDTVIYGGDIAMTDEPRVSAQRLEKLNGRKMVILGNHDDSIDPETFTYPCVEHTIIQNQGYRFWYTHNPDDVPSHWNQWILHGHVHNNEPFIRYDQKKINVSVECLNYKPISLKSIVEILKRLNGGDIVSNIEEAPDI